MGVDGALEGILSESGFADVRAKKVSVTLRLESADAALEMMQTAFGVYRAAVAELGDARRDAAWSEVREFLGQFDTDSGWRTELEVVIGAGTAPP